MRYLIIGLGIYGSNLALDLTEMGHEVIGADIRATNVELVKDYISTVYQIDSTEESALEVLPLRNVDIVIVAIGEDFGASVRTVALLKKNGVQHIYARAIDKIHESILQGFQVDRILMPEQRAASDLSHELELGNWVQSLAVDSDHYVMKFPAPAFFTGVAYADLRLDRNYNLTLIAATRPMQCPNIMGICHPVQAALDLTASNEQVQSGDVLTIYGTRAAFHALYKHIR